MLNTAEMWCDVQNPVMMGLQATATKRKFEEGVTEADDSDWTLRPQAKVVRTEGGVGDDWGVDSTSAALATSLLSDAADDSDDDDDEDDVEEGDEATTYLPSGRGYQLGYTSSPQPTYDPAGYQYCGARGYRGYWGAPQPSPPAPAGYYRQDVVPPAPTAAQTPVQQSPPPPPAPASHQQTIRCDENGKSYLDLGSSSSSYPSSSAAQLSAVNTSATKCCDGSRTSWCARGPGSCYRQRRLAVLNLSMCKLGRYRQFSDPSLRRSVLICNTLRLLEREMEQDGCFFGAPAPREPCATPGGPGGSPSPSPAPQPPSAPYQQMQFPETVGYPPATPYRVPEPTAYEQNFRELTTPLRPTPFPSPAHPGCDADSGLGDDDSTRGINWGSVLSLSSQSDLDPLNNNELFPSPPSPAPSHSDSLGILGDDDLGHEFDDFLPSWKLTPLSADDLLKSVPSTTPAEGELDSIMHVLVGT